MTGPTVVTQTVPNLGQMLADIEAATSLPALWSLMLRHYREAGFGGVAYLLFARGRIDKTKALLESGFPVEVVSRFADMGYGRNAPMIRIAMATGKPQIGSQLPKRHRLSRAEQEHREAIVRAGLNEALALPLYGPFGRDAVVFLAEARCSSLYDNAGLPPLHMVAQCAHLRAFSLRAPNDVVDHGLSEREVEILRWVAQGKSNSVIADILSLSAATVDTYLRRVFDKLEVADRTSAAVRGVSLGLIRA